MENKYGYKVCYKQFGKSKYKIHLICNTFDGAKWHILYYENHKVYNLITNKLIENIEGWKIIPIKTFIEYKWLWKGCPF